MSAYWVTCYRAVHDPEKVAAYGKLAGPAIQAAGSRFVTRGDAEAVFEAGQLMRTVVIEFDSVDAAVAAYRRPDYEEALAALGDGAERDIRIVPGAG